VVPAVNDAVIAELPAAMQEVGEHPESRKTSMLFCILLRAMVWLPVAVGVKLNIFSGPLSFHEVHEYVDAQFVSPDVVLFSGCPHASAAAFEQSSTVQAGGGVGHVTRISKLLVCDGILPSTAI
jgi:hypothetical protein